MKKIILALLILPAILSAQPDVMTAKRIRATQVLQLGLREVNEISADTTLGLSDLKLVTQRAVKKYADTRLGGRALASTTPITGQTIKWNGAAHLWEPADDLGGGIADGNGIYTGSGSLSANTVVETGANTIVFASDWVVSQDPFSAAGGLETGKSATYVRHTNGQGQRLEAASAPQSYQIKVSSSDFALGELTSGRIEILPESVNISGNNLQSSALIELIPSKIQFSYTDFVSGATNEIRAGEQGINIVASGGAAILINSSGGPATWTQDAQFGLQFSSPTDATLQGIDTQVADMQAIKDVVQVGSGLNKTTGSGNVTLSVVPSQVFANVQFANLGNITGATISPGLTLPTTAQGRRIELYRSGIKMRHGSDYTNTSTTITLTVSADLEPFEIYINP